MIYLLVVIPVLVVLVILFRRWRKKAIKKGLGISILIPFRAGNSPEGRQRQATLDWLLEFYRFNLPKAQISVGADKYPDLVFNKCEAFNDAARKAKGDVFLLLDSDALLNPAVVVADAERLRRARRERRRLWAIPYRRLYRLTQSVSVAILSTNPRRGWSLPDVADEGSCEPTWDEYVSQGHQWGAMAIMIPKQAYKVLGGIPQGHRGWGGDDWCIMAALDTLYGPHITTDNPIYHLWHPHIGNRAADRAWEGGRAHSNDALNARFSAAHGDAEKMRELLDDLKKDFG